MSENANPGQADSGDVQDAAPAANPFEAPRTATAVADANPVIQPADVASRQSVLRKWWFWLLVTAGLLVGAGIVVFVIAARSVGDDAAISQQRPATLLTPSSVAGLELSEDPQLLAIAEAGKQEILAVGEGLVTEDQVTVVHYEDPEAADRLVWLQGSTASLTEPDIALDGAFFEVASSSGWTVNDESSVDPGRMGGVARCGQAEYNGVQIALCGWADHGSVVMGFLLNRDVAESAELLIEIREVMLVRG